MIEDRQFAQNNKASPLGFSRICRLALNGEHVAEGIWAKRRGISTDRDVDMQIGTASPFWFYIWKIGSTFYRVAIGDDAAVVHSPWSNYLYELSVTNPQGAIWSGPDTNIDTFGLDAPTLAGTGYAEAETKHVGQPYSGFAAGFYKYVAASYSTVRWCKSPWVEIPCETPDEAHTDGKLLKVGGPIQYAEIPAVTIDGLANKAWYYRARVLSVDIGSYVAGKGENQLRFINENEGDAWTDYGQEVYGDVSALWDFATDPIPSCDKAIWWEGRAFWLKGDRTGCHHFLYWSNPRCPETTGLNNYAIMYDDGEGAISGEFYLAVPTECGTPKGLVAKGDTLLVLCEHGAWRVVRNQSLEGVYVLMQDNLWVGCASAATIAHGPEGAYWVSHDGPVVWDGVNAPFVVTQRILDTTHSDTQFASDLSEACGAYDEDRRLYICVVPKSGGGQFGLCIYGEALPDEVLYSTWTFGDNLPTITGMGYDWNTREVIYGFGTTTVTAKTQVDGVWRDNDPTTGDTYECAIEVWAGDLPKRGGEDKVGVACRVFVDRPDISVEQSVSVYMDALRTTEEATFGDAETLTWAANAVKPQWCQHEADRGRLLRVRVSNTDEYGLSFRAIQVGTPEEIKEKHGAMN